MIALKQLLDPLNNALDLKLRHNVNWNSSND